MNTIGLIIFALGVVLLILGFNESQSFSSDVSRVFAGNPTDRSMWLIAGGTVAIIVGMVLALRGMKRS
jgi:multisubunit Na+/H+ antiporter MnhB subunit